MTRRQPASAGQTPLSAALCAWSYLNPRARNRGWHLGLTRALAERMHGSMSALLLSPRSRRIAWRLASPIAEFTNCVDGLARYQAASHLEIGLDRKIESGTWRVTCDAARLTIDCSPEMLVELTSGFAWAAKGYDDFCVWPEDEPYEQVSPLWFWLADPESRGPRRR